VKVLIFGSCVSRDALEFSQDNDLSLDGYYARSSLGSAFSCKPVSSVDTDKIESAFQRRMVKADLEKTFISSLKTKSYDLILYDPIDERFNLIKLPNGSLCTLSNELMLTKLHESKDVSLIFSGSDEFYDLWERGWREFINALLAFGAMSKLRINEVYWADRAESGENYEPVYSSKKIVQSNQFLRKLYRRMRQDIPSWQFYTFSSEDLIGGSGHKWGRSPFHFVDRYYENLLRKILNESPIKKRAELTMSDNNLAEGKISEDDLRRLWLNFNKGIFIGGDYTLLGDMSDAMIDSLTGNVKECYSPDNLWAHMFSLDEQAKVKNLLVEMATGEFRSRLLDQAFAQDKLSISSLFGEGTAICTQSIYAQNRNFLRFVDVGEVFYIVQHHKFARALYFPLREVVIVIDVIALPVSSIYALNRHIAKLAATFSNKKTTGDARFVGPIVSYPRPYHFFYDTLPSFYNSIKSVGPTDGYSILSVDEGNFFPVGNLLDDSKNSQKSFKDSASLNEYLVDNNLFAVQFGYSDKRGNIFDPLDKELINYSLRSLSENDKEILAGIEGCYPVLWFGICTEKRQWKEQVEGIVKIVNDMSERYPKVAAIFDGITRTLSESREFVRSSKAQNELNILNEIRSSLCSKVKVIDLIGVTAAEKIAYASVVDFFLTSFLTDSMYVARFAKRAGVAHGANVAMHADHYHPQTYFIPKNFVRDLDAGANWACVSYSVDPEVVCRIFKSCFEESLRERAALRLFSSRQGLIRSVDGCCFVALSEFGGDKPVYVSVNGSNINFAKISSDAELVQSGKLYDFYFRGSAGEGVSASLVIIGYDANERVCIDRVSIGFNKAIKFAVDVKYYRLFIRFKGSKDVRIDEIKVRIYDEESGASSLLARPIDIVPRDKSTGFIRVLKRLFTK